MESSLAADVSDIIDKGVYSASASVNQIAALTYWRVGRRIVEEIKRGEDRAEYGARVISELAAELAPRYGGQYSKRNLDYFCRFYRQFPDFEIVNARVHNLTWTHYRLLLGVINDDARYWYMREADRETWSSRTLSRNIGSQYYQRLLASPKKDTVIAEMLEKTAVNPPANAEMVKSPVIAEFLGLPANSATRAQNYLPSPLPCPLGRCSSSPPIGRDESRPHRGGGEEKYLRQRSFNSAAMRRV